MQWSIFHEPFFVETETFLSKKVYLKINSKRFSLCLKIKFRKKVSNGKSSKLEQLRSNKKAFNTVS